MGGAKTRNKTNPPASDEENHGKDEKVLQLETLVEKKQRKKKRAATSDPVTESTGSENIGYEEAMDGVLVEDDLNELTIGDKLSILNLGTDEAITNAIQEPPPLTKPPRADSVHVLLKQALNADDHTLLLDCLYTQDEKVISNSTSVLSSSDVLKLLNSLIRIIQSRGALLACALPWLKSLLLQHASRIMSQESSLLALNSLYQLIESRVSTFRSALQLSSSANFLFTEMVDEGLGEGDKITPIIYEDNDESEDAMETNGEDDHEKAETSDGAISDIEGIDNMS